MAKTRRTRQTRESRPPTIICPHCGTPIVQDQQVTPVFAPTLVTWAEHPVLSKPVMLRGSIALDGSASYSDLSVSEQLQQRAAMGGAKERAELAAYEALWTRAVVDALVADVRAEAAAKGVSVWTLLAKQPEEGE